MEKGFLHYRGIIWMMMMMCSTETKNFLPSIQWTPENPLFKNLNGEAFTVNIDDEMRIWCPRHYTQMTQTKQQLSAHNLYFSLYKVDTKQEFDECNATRGKRLLYCNDPFDENSKNQKELQILFMAIPFFNHMEAYPPGRTYYFIGTSGGTEEQLNNKIGGKCTADQMKLAIYVCEREENCETRVLNGGWSLWTYNETTGLCERNCSDPVPHNGGEKCKGERRVECSKIINGRDVNKKPSEKMIPTITTSTFTDNEPFKKMMRQTENVSMTTPTSTVNILTKLDIKDLDETKPQERKNDSVNLSIKEAVLTFVGLVFLGFILGILVVFAKFYFCANMSKKEKELQDPINRV